MIGLKGMNFMKEAMILALGLLSAVPAFATDTGPLMNSSNDPYQILKTSFDGAGIARINDFHTLEDLSSPNPTMKCVALTAPGSVNMQRYTELTPVFVGRLSMVSAPEIPATAGNGPLFPGTPDIPAASTSVISLFIIGSYGYGFSHNQWSTDFTSGNDASVITTEMSSGDLQSITTMNNFPGLTWIDTFRKNGSLLFIREVLSSSDSMKSGGVAYGYCYPTAQN